MNEIFDTDREIIFRYQVHLDDGWNLGTCCEWGKVRQTPLNVKQSATRSGLSSPDPVGRLAKSLELF